jgi:hypothetical protein
VRFLGQLAVKLQDVGGKLVLLLRHVQQHPAVRWLVRLIRRHLPGLLLLVFAVPVVVLIGLDAFDSGVRKPLDHWADHHKVAGDLLWHAMVAAGVAAVAVYWVLGRKRQKALKSYRGIACTEPASFVEWSRGGTPVVRDRICERLADAIQRPGPQPALAVLQGRPGTGRTSCVVGLVEKLAERTMIPIPILAKQDGSFELEKLARQKFCDQVDEVVSSDEQADAIWHRAKTARDIVILVDGLDDEIVGKLSTDGGNGFRKVISDLRRNGIAVVLATTRELPLGDITPLREDLDLFNWEETEDYVRNTLDESKDQKAALQALERLHEPVDIFVVAPFYVDLVVRLQKARLSLERLPRQTDRWRAAVLKRYLNGVKWGQIGIAGADEGDLHSRSRAALAATEEVADTLEIDEADRLSVPRSKLKSDDLALRDAEDLNLLWRGDATVGFASEDLGAYVAAKTKPWEQVLEDVALVAECDYPRNRRDRFVRSCLIFWHLRHPDDRVPKFEAFLERLEACRFPRPSIVLAAVRLVCACTQLQGFARRVASEADVCIDLLETREQREARPLHAYELLGLVRALAAWPHERAHWLLWKLATNQNLEIEWWAAKALALSDGEPAQTLELEIKGVISTAALPQQQKRINRHPDPIGQKVASLAWILPALRHDPRAAPYFSSLEEICLDPQLSPLRGEMALAQGLKLAILNGRMVDENVKLVRKLLVERKLRFWHARLVLVHALLAHAWEQRKKALEIRVDLDGVLVHESHLLVRKGIELALGGLLDLERARSTDETPTKYTYMWSHEREAVRWVDLGRDALAQLAADAVLLGNMTYRLWEDKDEAEANRARDVAVRDDLPACIEKSSRRKNIDVACDCAHGLCRDAPDKAVLAGRAQFSAGFCRDQARLVGQSGSPSWVRWASRRKQRLKEFWDDQADVVQSQPNSTTPASATAATTRAEPARRRVGRAA